MILVVVLSAQGLMDSTSSPPPYRCPHLEHHLRLSLRVEDLDVDVSRVLSDPLLLSLEALFAYLRAHLDQGQ